MPDYRRNRLPGGTYFFTVNLRDRRSDLLFKEITALREAVRRTRASAPFHIDAWVVLPDHMLCIWTLPEGDSNYAGRWRSLKTIFSKSLPVRSTKSDLRNGEEIWQRRYWEHTIRDDRDYAAHMDYVHFNPVKHGFASHPADWPFSSFRRSVEKGLYPADWVKSDEVTSEGSTMESAQKKMADDAALFRPTNRSMKDTNRRLPSHVGRKSAASSAISLNGRFLAARQSISVLSPSTP